MESALYDYSYENYTDTDPPVAPCDRESENYVGSQLSIIYYFMFLFSLFGNVLVLVIIHR